MNYSNKQIFILLAAIPNVIAALVVIFRWKTLATTLRPLAILVLFALTTELISRVLWFLKTSNMFMWPVYISIEFSLLLWLYSQTVSHTFLLIRYRWFFIAALALLAMLEPVLHASQPFIVANIARLLESILVIALTLAYYHSSLRQPTTAYIWQEPLFWVSSGLLLFFAGNFLIYTFIQYLYYYHKQRILEVWIVHDILVSLLYCTYAYALWISPKK